MAHRVDLVIDSIRSQNGRYLDALPEAYFLQPDVIVNTFPFFQAPLGAYLTLKNHYTPLITVVTDLATIHFTWYHRAADFCLVPTARAAKLAIEYGLSPETVKITGIPVRPEFAEKQDKAALRVALASHADRISGWLDSLGPEGIVTPFTRPGPTASAAIAAVRAESIPPLSPTTPP